MLFFYNLAMSMMSPIMRLVGIFKPKARLWSLGRKDIFSKMASQITLGERIVWFHVASLGEFEQGRPLIELMRRHHPEYKILVTFFSPSGYQVRKNYDGADYIFYLPTDTPRNVQRFMSIVRPSAAFFIKYEFWLNYLGALRESGTPTFLVSSIFRDSQVFFKPYGGAFRNALGAFTHIFTQNQQSVDLLKTIGVDNATAIGDTRFDRVYDIVSSAGSLPIVESFLAETEAGKCFVAGSTWPPDEKILVELINSKPDVKFVIAPHEIDAQRIEVLRQQIVGGSVLYTDYAEGGVQAEQQQGLASAQVLFINTIGVLSSAYQYGFAAYIGGGFGVGIHNTLEAATFAMPIAFGPNYKRFQEACQLIERTGAVSVSDDAQLKKWFEDVIENQDARVIASKACGDYVAQNIGASKAVLEFFDRTISK